MVFGLKVVFGLVGLLLGVAGHLGASRGSLGIAAVARRKGPSPAAAHERAKTQGFRVKTAAKRQKPLFRVYL